MTHDVDRLADNGAIDALIFDCDGTLALTAPLYLRAITQALAPHAITIPAAWYHERGGLSEGALFDALEDHTGRRLDRAAITATARAVFHADLHSVGEIPAVTAIARRYHGRLPLAVASAGPRANVTAVLRVTGLAHLFDHVVTIDEVPTPKPAPDLFLEAARRLGIAPDRCLVFEDSAQGLQGAAAAGMRVIDVATLT